VKFINSNRLFTEKKIPPQEGEGKIFGGDRMKLLVAEETPDVFQNTRRKTHSCEVPSELSEFVVHAVNRY